MGASAWVVALRERGTRISPLGETLQKHKPEEDTADMKHESDLMYFNVQIQGLIPVEDSLQTKKRIK